MRCGEPLAAGLDCQHCRSHPLPFDAVHSLYLYADPVDQMITGLKFGRELMFARVLGTLFARSLRSRHQPLPDCIVPMPLHHTRYIERGFNQSAEIARHTARRVGVPVNPRLLERCRATLPQSGLDAAARRSNMAGAFRVTAGCKMPAHIALLDDVLTTGHTAAAAAQVLKDSGCQSVEIWACARALRSAPTYGE
jgi:ComF family protein